MTMTTGLAPLPQWAREPLTAEQYDSLPEEICRDIEIVDGMVRVSPSPTTRHNRMAKKLSIALEAGADEGWLADMDFDVRLQDVPLINRRPDVTVYRADAIDIMPKRPEHVVMVVEIVSPGSETNDRTSKHSEYATAGIQYYWRIERAESQLPIVHTYVLDEATHAYVATEVFKGHVKASAPFPVEIDLREI